MNCLKYFCMILILILLKCYWCFNVNFRENYNIQVEPFKTQVFKREMTQFFDKASFHFDGFQKVASVPVLFPLDICMMNLNGITYATTLHINKDGVRHFAVYRLMNGTYIPIAEIPTPLAITMDCNEIGEKGYIALAYNISEPVHNARDGSPVFQIANERLRAVQYFASPHISTVHLHTTGNDLYMLQTFKNTAALPNLKCPFFKWSGTTFNKLAPIPCSNAHHLEAFSIDYENYVAVANYANQLGRTETYSEIYKYVHERRKFQLLQRIRTNGAIDVKYFSVPYNNARRHFLLFGNTISSQHKSTEILKGKQQEERNLEADSVFYIFDKGEFVPYQKLSFYDLLQFLPVQNSEAEKFLLLVSCKNQDVKIYNFNDWKFEESKIQFTEGALGKGVSHMRIFQEYDNSYLIIANELMSANETNIFLPIFKQDEQANALRQELIEWTKHNIERLSNIDVEKLKKDVELKLAQQKNIKTPITVTEIPSSNIETVITTSLIYPPFRISSNYWKALSYATQALDVLETQLSSKTTTLREKRASLRDSNAKNNAPYDFERLKVNTLIVHDKLKVRKVNSFDSELGELEEIKAKKVVVTDKYELIGETKKVNTTTKYGDEIVDSLSINNLHISGKLNEYTWDNLINNTLKRNGLQFLKAPVTLKNLHVDKITITNNEVNEQNLAKLVSTTDGSYVVDQDIQFAEPIKTKNLNIHERLNNIHVYKNRFDVLLRNSNETQVIEGLKRLDSVRVLEPITLAGQTTGKHLREMAPNKAVHESITLQGDYTITGDVTISKLLTANDIVDAKTKMSTKHAIHNGIRMDIPLEKVFLNFQQPIKANNSLVSFINAQDLQQLVYTNTTDVQVIEGEKIFNGNLEIKKGFSEVKNLNGIDLEAIEKRLFLRNKNQTINGTMNFGKIVVKSIESPQILLNSRNLSDYLTKSGTQQILGTVQVGNLSTNTINVIDLHTNGKIFNEHLAEIYQQKAQNIPTSNIFQKNQKFHGSIYVRNLKLNSSINGKSIELIERQLTQLDGNIKYVGNLKFNYNMQISNLTFYGSFNGIPAQEFGLCWLQKHGDQMFTAPQTLSSVQCEKGMQAEGKLNGYKLDDFIKNTFWINRDEHVGSVIFKNPIRLQAALNARTFNDLQIPNDILYRSAAAAQILMNEISVEQKLFIQGHILNNTIINSLNIRDLDKHLSGYGTDTLYVENANFSNAPLYNTLNHYDLQQVLDTVWLANENVDLQKHVEIMNGSFEGLLEFEGPINNVNLKYLSDNYFSLTRPQEILTEVMFLNAVQFQNDIFVNDLHLFGPLIESTSNATVDFNDFAANTLKKSGQHDINGQWKISQAHLQGNLHNVLVNNLNFVHDVIRNDVELNYVTALKRIHAASNMKKLYATPTSLVNDINLVTWLKDAVFVYENYTVSGITTLDTVNFYNDLLVDGSVNNVTFDTKTLLLNKHDQVLRGPVRIRNKFPAQQRILANNFENLNVENINGWNLTEFYANQAKLGPAVNVRGNLIFSNPMRVEQEYSGGDNSSKVFAEAIKWKRDTPTGGLREISSITSWQELQRNVDALEESYTNSNHVLDSFLVRQVLCVSAKKIIPLSFPSKDNKFIDVIAVLNDSQAYSMDIYIWHTEEEKFVLSNDISIKPQDAAYTDFLQMLAFTRSDLLKLENSAVSVSEKKDITIENAIGLQKLLQINAKKNCKVTGFAMQNKDCFAIYSYDSKDIALYCLEITKTDSQLNIVEHLTIERENVLQISALSNNLIALLFTDAIEIWNTSSTLKPVQRMPIVMAKQMDVGVKDDILYLAVISARKEKSLHYGAVELFRASRNNLTFHHMQTIDCIDPMQLEFALIQQSYDLLLNILTSTQNQPLIVFQYKGIAGFEQIVASSTLPGAIEMHFLRLRSTEKHLIALLGMHKITFIEVLLKKY